MLIMLDFTDDVPIYMQIRNQIVMGIADGRLAQGEKLPTIRALANESGINMMTANKAYALLKQEGYTQTDRRSGVVVSDKIKGGLSRGSDSRGNDSKGDASKGEDSGGSMIAEKTKSKLRLLIAEAKLDGVSEPDFLTLCRLIYQEMEVSN